MPEKLLNTRIKHKRDTQARWEQYNPVILNGEIILVDMTDGQLRAKVGNGTSRYLELPFSDETLRSLIDNKVNGKGLSSIYVQDSAPAAPSEGDMWIDVTEDSYQVAAKLPRVNAADEGKVMQVIDGKWQVSSLTSGDGEIVTQGKLEEVTTVSQADLDSMLEEVLA